MVNRVNLVCETTGEFRESHQFSGVNGDKIVALLTDLLYTSRTGMKDTIAVMVYKGSKFEHYLSPKGVMVVVRGELTTFNKDLGDEKILESYVSPKLIKRLPKEIQNQENQIILQGVVCGDEFSKSLKADFCSIDKLLKVPLENGNYTFVRAVAFRDYNFMKFLNLRNGECIEVKGKIFSKKKKFKYMHKGVQKVLTKNVLEVGVTEFKIIGDRIIDNPVEKLPVYKKK